MQAGGRRAGSSKSISLYLAACFPPKAGSPSLPAKNEPIRGATLLRGLFSAGAQSCPLAPSLARTFPPCQTSQLWEEKGLGFFSFFASSSLEFRG